MSTIDEILGFSNDDLKKSVDQAKNILNDFADFNTSTFHKMIKDANRIPTFDEFKDNLAINIDEITKQVVGLSDKSLKLIQEKLGEYIEQASGKLSPEHLKSLQDAFHTMNLETAVRNPGKGFFAGINSRKKAIKEAKQAQKDLDTILSGGTVLIEKYDENTLKTTKSVLSLADAEKRLVDAENAKMSALSESSKALNETGKYGQASVDAAKGVSGMLKDFGVDVPEFVDGALSGVGQVMDGIASIDLTNPVSWIQGISSALKGLATFTASMFGAADYDNEKRIKEIQKEVDALTKSYSKLQEQISESHSTDKASFIQEYNAKLEEQKRLIEEQIRLEDEKKKTDDEQINAYKQEIENINKQIEANNKAWQEAVTGVSFDSFRQSFLNTLLDMNSDAEDFANNFEKYLQNAIIEAMLTEKYNGVINDLYDNFSEKMKDGLTEKESIELRNVQELLAQQMLNERDALAEVFGWNNNSDESVGRTANAAKGIAQASQESVDELNGRMTAMQSHTFSLMENTKVLVDNSASMLERLFNIDVNTTRLAYIEKDIHSIGACLNQMSIQGVRIAV